MLLSGLDHRSGQLGRQLAEALDNQYPRNEQMEAAVRPLAAIIESMKKAMPRMRAAP